MLVISILVESEDNEDAYLALFTLIRAHFIVCIDGNKLKNDRKCTPCIEELIENVHHRCQKGIHWQCPY